MIVYVLDAFKVTVPKDDQSELMQKALMWQNTCHPLYVHREERNKYVVSDGDCFYFINKEACTVEDPMPLCL